MPELPEIEVTRRRLAPHLLGRRIAEARTTSPSYVFLTTPRRLASGLRGRRVEDLQRVGKYLLAVLDDGVRLLVHLGMTGDFGATREPPDGHTHLLLRFADRGPDVAFRDPRKFGKLQLLAPGQRSTRLDVLGVDALAANGAEVLRAATRRRRAAIKAVLLDQSVLAGVGNIYADEALFAARIRPARSARRLTVAECARLADAVRRVLRRAIERGAGYGERPDAFRVYGRTGEPCRRCGTSIARRVIATRSSHYCPRCQR
jgi:formamidopyrimidine-DNA glycosylase